MIVVEPLVDKINFSLENYFWLRLNRTHTFYSWKVESSMFLSTIPLVCHGLTFIHIKNSICSI